MLQSICNNILKKKLKKTIKQPCWHDKNIKFRGIVLCPPDLNNNPIYVNKDSQMHQATNMYMS